MDYDSPDSSAGWWDRFKAHLPGVTPNIGLSPSVSLSPSDSAKEKKALADLCAGLSRRQVLFAGFELERPGEASESAKSIVEEADTTRRELPPGSRFDAAIEWLQDASNEFRADLRRREAEVYPFGQSLLEFRSLVLQWAEAIYEETALDQGKRLRLKIRLDNAVNPMGPSRTIYVEPRPGAVPDPHDH